MAETSGHGRFVWYDLFSSDPDHSHDFYKSVLGWKTQPMPGHAETDMWTTKGTTFGSVGKLPEGGSAASHWLPYVGVVDVNATLAHAQDLGGEVLLPSTPTGTGGNYAVVKDPQGAAIGIYGPVRGEQKPLSMFSWHELSTSDHDAAFRFYRELFGWDNAGTHDMGPMGYYQLFGLEGVQRGGMFTPQAGQGPARAHWLIYASVKDINETARRVRDAGGRVVTGPMEVPGGDWVVVFTDPQGAAVAAHQLKPAVSAAPTPPAAPAEKSAVSTEVANEVKKVARKVAAVAAEVGSTLQRAARRTAAAVKKATKKTAAKKPAAKKAKKKAPVKSRGKARVTTKARPKSRTKAKAKAKASVAKGKSRRGSRSAKRVTRATARRGTRTVRRAKRARRR